MINKVMERLKKRHIVPDHFNVCLPLQGGTESEVYSLGTEENPRQWVIKFNTKEQIERETRFYERYQHTKLLPHVKYVDQAFNYFIYEFIRGRPTVDRGAKSIWMEQLIDHFIVHYNKLNIHTDHMSDYAEPEHPAQVEGSMKWCSSVIGTHLDDSDHALIWRIHERRKDRLTSSEMYVLHGDLGVHNFLFEKGEIKGIIDPIPSIGRRVYDLLYAFCSSPDDLQLSLLLNMVDRLSLPTTKEEVVDDFMMELYSRMGTCITYHPDDMPRYVEAWNDWKKHHVSL